MATLNYSGDKTLNSKSNAQDFLGTIIDVHTADNGLSVDSISMRLNGSDARVIVSVSAQGTTSELDSLAGTVANGAVNLGLEPDVSTARSSIDISGGV